MRKVVLLFALSLTVGCSYNIPMKKVELDSFFHDRSSKVWFIDRITDDGVDVTINNPNFRDVMIFYKSGNVIIQPLNSLGNRKGIKGLYSIDSDLNQLTIDQDSVVWKFDITDYSTNRIYLSPLEDSDLSYEMELTPLPELY